MSEKGLVVRTRTFELDFPGASIRPVHVICRVRRQLGRDVKTIELPIDAMRVMTDQESDFYYENGCYRLKLGGNVVCES